MVKQASLNDIEEKIYASALTEIDTVNLRRGVWAMAMAESEGDEQKCKALYIRMRFDQEKNRTAHPEYAEAFESESLIMRIWNGSNGLASTYWLYGVFVSCLFGVAIAIAKPEPGSAAAKLIVLLLAIYCAMINVAVWRAADKYKGPVAWASLAKGAVIVSAMLFLLPLVGVLFEAANF